MDTLSQTAPGVLTASAAATVRLDVPMGRLSLRARGDLGAVQGALGFALPERIGQRVEGAVQAIKLGPDEWTLLAADVAPIIEACAAVYADHPHSLTDISGREVTLVIDGPRAAELLTLGCPRDIDTIPVGEGRRTLCDGITVVIWRDAVESFRMDVWHSFAPHILHLFEIGCKELAAEI